MTGIAPILDRIASIEARFGHTTAPRPVAASTTTPTSGTTAGTATTVTGTAPSDRFDQVLAAAEQAFPGVTDGGTSLPPGVAVISTTPSTLTPFTSTPASSTSITGTAAASSPTAGTASTISPSDLARPSVIDDTNPIVATFQLPVQVPAQAPAAASTSSAVAPVSTPSAVAAVIPADTPFAAEFSRSATEHGVPADLLAAVGWVESRYDVDALSPDGAIGVMQIMPDTAAHLGVDPSDPTAAIDGAARLLRDHFDRFGTWELSLAAYFSGPGAVAAAGNQAPPRGAEYARRVMTRMDTA